MRVLSPSVILIPCLALCLLLGACSDDRAGYSQASPEATIETAKLMVSGGHPDRLQELILARNEDERRMLMQAGVVMEDLHRLADTLIESFPEEVEAMKARAREAVENGEAKGLMAQLMTSRDIQIGGGDPSQKINDAIVGFFVDPYGWLEDQEDRLGTVYMTDDAVALTWDDTPLFQPVGLTLRRESDEKWYLVPPTALPMVGRYAPKTKDEFTIIGQLLKSVHNTAVDLEAAVREGRVTSLEDVSSQAGEYIFVPVAMTFYAYERAVSDRVRRERKEREAAETSSPEEGG